MSFDKNYPNRKDQRKPAEKADERCRNHGSCSRCLSDRTYNNEKRKQQFDPKLE